MTRARQDSTITDLETMAAVGPTESKAVKDLKNQLPFDPKSGKYLVFDIKTQTMANGYLATAYYKLREDSKVQDKVKRSGPGSYKTSLERCVEDRDTYL